MTSQKVSDAGSEEAHKLTHRLIEGVTEDLHKMFFNTAIAKMMEFLNDFSKLSVYPIEDLKKVAILLSPFAPHLAEEFWEMLGSHGSVVDAPWPIPDPRYLVDEQVTYVVQVNGKLRGRFELPKDQPQEVIVKLAQDNPQVSKHLAGPVKKIIFVPNKLLNFVCE